MISKNGTNKRVPKTKQHNNKQTNETKQNKQKIKQRKSDNVIFFKYFTQIERSAHLSGLLNCIFLVAVPTILVVSVSYWWDFIWVSIYYLMLGTSISVSELNQFLIKPGRACLKIYRFGFIKMEYARYWCSFSFVFVFDLNWVKWYNNLTDRHVNGEFCRINSDACVPTNDKEEN